MRRARGGVAGNADGGEEMPRGRTRWWPAAALVALAALVLLPVLTVLVAVVGLVASDSEYPLGGGPEQRPCPEALGFGGAALPDGAQPAGACTRQGWQDIHYSAVFRMPRAGVAEWLAHTYPDAPAPETEYCGGAAVDLCLDLGYAQGLPDGVDAHAVQVSVEYLDAGTALVRFSAFTL
ncbi:hypothetical protein ACFW4M_07235 [Streptomyces sp. NPDC058794]|uniref:hypothetical protein n=1 Tax=unclassified Streptomyces TaxID=2593676 RepID=UPI003675F821